MKLRLFTFMTACVLAVAVSAEPPAKILDGARRGEVSAYLAMADGYRYGQNGFDKGLFNAKMCYEPAGLDFDSIVEQAYSADPNDDFGLMFTLLDVAGYQGLEAANAKLGSIELPEAGWAETFKNIVSNYHRPDIVDYIASQIGEDTAGDEDMVAFMMLHILSNEGQKVGNVEALNVIPAKVPFLNNLVGEKMLQAYLDDTDADTQYLHRAIEYFKLANDSGMLTPANALRLLAIGESSPEALSQHFSTEELAAMKQLAAKVNLNIID